MSLFARKPIPDPLASEGSAQSLKRVLGAGDLVLLAIGAVMRGHLRRDRNGGRGAGGSGRRDHPVRRGPRPDSVVRVVPVMTMPTTT
jgi:hypothetical protein